MTGTPPPPSLTHSGNSLLIRCKTVPRGMFNLGRFILSVALIAIFTCEVDGFCEGTPDGTYCVPVSYRVQCVNHVVVETRKCPHGCSDGQCDDLSFTAKWLPLILSATFFVLLMAIALIVINMECLKKATITYIYDRQ